MMMGKQVRETKQNSPQTTTSGQFDPRPFASPEPEHETLGREGQFGHSFGEIGLFPIQPKLKLGPPGDRYEQEADRVAEQVVRMPEPCPQVKPTTQKKQASDQTSQVCPRVEAGIRSSRGSSRPLPKSTRAFFEPRFGHDFSQVRVHTDSKATKLAGAMNALGFTTGKDIFLKQDVYRPGSFEGQRLLAHELTHVVQQSDLKTRLENGAPKDHFEQENGNIGDQRQAEVTGVPFLEIQQGTATTLQRAAPQTTVPGIDTVVPMRCGPDVTAWLIDEMNRNKNHPVIRTMREVRWPRYVPGFNIGWTAGALYDFAQLVRGGGPWDFKSHQGRTGSGEWRAAPGRNCPTDNCDQTVTLCGTCVNYDVPGNIHFGWVGAAASLRSWLLHFGAGIVQPNRWTDDPRDAVAVEIGEEMWNSGTDLCSQIRSRRSELNLDRTENCLSCNHQ